jgi:hypothetical protein
LQVGSHTMTKVILERQPAGGLDLICVEEPSRHHASEVGFNPEAIRLNVK